MIETEAPLAKWAVQQFVKTELRDSQPPCVDPDLLELTEVPTREFYGVIESTLKSITEHHEPRDLTAIGRGLTSVMCGLTSHYDRELSHLGAFKGITKAIQTNPSYALRLLDEVETAMLADAKVKSHGITDRDYLFVPTLTDRLETTEDVPRLMGVIMRNLPENGNVPFNTIPYILEQQLGDETPEEDCCESRTDQWCPDYISTQIAEIGHAAAAERFRDEVGIFAITPKGNRSRKEEKLSINYAKGRETGQTCTLTWAQGMDKDTKRFCYELAKSVGQGGLKAANHYAIQLGLKK